ncbi:unknown [Bacteroides sp. CAG:661]|nr:unknown [Bacteroides sp. CAG:661]
MNKTSFLLKENTLAKTWKAFNDLASFPYLF